MTVNKVDDPAKFFASFANALRTLRLSLFTAKDAKKHRKGRKERLDNSLPGCSPGLSSLPGEASYTGGFLGPLSSYWQRAEKLAGGAAAGFPGGRPPVAGRAAHHRCAVGPFLGGARGRVSVCPPDRRRAWRRRSGPDRHVQVGRLGTSYLRSDSVRCHCRRGWFSAPALPDEAHRQGAGVGFHPGADRAGDDYSILGCAAGTTLAGCTVRVLGPAGPNLVLMPLPPLRPSRNLCVLCG